MKDHLLAQLNIAIGAYFKKNPSVETVSAKDLMPYFIEAGIFEKDHKSGLPIRKILRELDTENSLHLIPCVRQERKQKNTNWFFDNI
ncbi:hypothetical protein [Olivibacter jilunii]|uniref:hypothetical protein n=1 Tax=Olivibacter jilunii TaxID=985016 RepID=UPI003F173525